MNRDRVFDMSPEQLRDMQRPNPSPIVETRTGRGDGVEVTMARHADGSATVLDEHGFVGIDPGREPARRSVTFMPHLYPKQREFFLSQAKRKAICVRGRGLR